jgi:hypothetical protein
MAINGEKIGERSMRGTVAKRLRQKAFGKKSKRIREYQKVDRTKMILVGGKPKKVEAYQIVHNPMSPIGVYKILKRRYKDGSL